MKQMKNLQPSFADQEMTMRVFALARKDPLVMLSNTINWEVFVPILEKACLVDPKKPGGRPPIHLLIKFKMLIIQKMYDLAFERLELMVSDRLTFRSFVGLSFEDEIPDGNTIWDFHERLIEKAVMDELWELFNAELMKHDLIINSGRIIDAEIVEVKRRHLDSDEKDKLKEDPAATDWTENQHRKSQVDTKATWTGKHGKHYFGYKNTVNIDAATKFILDYQVDTASRHDSEMLGDVLDAQRDAGNDVYADKGYAGQKCETAIINSAGSQRSRILHKAKRGKELTPEQKEENRLWSKTRARVEHVFAWRKYVMGQGIIRSKNEARAAFTIGMGNLLYNFSRLTFLLRPEAVLFR